MATLTITQIYSLLTEKLGKETAENLTNFISEKIKEDVDLSTKENATKDFVAKEIARPKADIIKWMFIFWIGQIAVLSGIIFTMFNLYFKR